MNKLLVYGAGGLGRGVIDLLETINSTSSNKWEIIGLIDDQYTGIINEYEVIGNMQHLINWNEQISVVVAVGNPLAKNNIVKTLQENENLLFPTIIHPSVAISRFNKIGMGNIISSGVSMSTNINIGDFNLLHYNSTIGHDVKIGNCNSVYPLTSLSGYVSINNNIEIGANSTILPSIQIQNNVRVGAGSVVVRDIKNEGITIAGVPARKLM